VTRILWRAGLASLKQDSRIFRLNRVKDIRFAFIAAAAALFFFVYQLASGPIQAARRNAGQAEQVPPAGAHAPLDPGAASYAKHCAICHGDEREGILPGFPPLLGINHRMTEDKIADLIHSGKGRMPGFPQLQNGELSGLLHFLTAAESASAAGEQGGESDISEAGGRLFRQNCAFCHGRDAMGGETGPDLTQSALVQSDNTGEKITAVVREGRPQPKKMPAFNFSSQEMRSIIAFIRQREAFAKAHPGGRRGVSVEDLQTGNVEAGKRYFDGPGGCAKCHSPRGDLAGIANRFQGLKLEEQMLYPENAKSRVTVRLPSGEQISGMLAFYDEFTIALRDKAGVYRSWATSRVKYKIDSPVDAHVELFNKYTDNDIHNLMAYLQTLK